MSGAAIGSGDTGRDAARAATGTCTGSGLAGLRVALVGPLPPPAGGMANQTRQLAELLRGAGAQVTLVQTNAPYRPAWAGKVPVLRAGARLLPYLGALWRAAGRSDVCHVMANSGWSWHLFAAPAIWVARARGVPVVVNYRGGEADAFLQRSGAAVRWSMRRVARLAVPSGFLQQVFTRHGMAAEVVPNIVDLARFTPAEPAGSAHLVVARNLEPIYDNATALRALALVRQRHPGAHMTIAGTGPELRRLQALAAQLGLGEEAVCFAGRLDRDAMAALYRRADVAINPSTVDNMPNSVLEALACGVPVVSTDVGGVPFIVRHGQTALLVGAGDAPAMAAAVVQLLDDGALRSRLRQAGLDDVQSYTWAHVAPVLASIYQAARNATGQRPVLS
ncbi:glycosyltransferase family 4 protein [Azohydromonas aeria]|uniref:glycosyltransferase family 4 protein n=1 Tax=Azohydromonas aeria TaxID=2590212 RepID=UPI0012F8787E|nr:glycosyltransferase family 4 protein [Azohydromonas aeria]